MAFQLSEDRPGFPAIGIVDTGKTVASGSTKPTVPLGTIVRGVDPTYGEGEFIMLAGVASTAVGSLVVYDGTSYATTLCPVTANLGRPVAVALQASTANQWGWYQIGGTAVVAKSTGFKCNPKTQLQIRSTAKVSSMPVAGGSGKQILGAITANTATVASATTTINVAMNRPHLQGRVT